jgi:hypothetical protein
MYNFIIMTLYEAPMLLVDKKYNKLDICINYCAFKKITIKNNYPLFQIDNMFDHLNGACYFNWVNLKLSYYQICIWMQMWKKWPWGLSVVFVNSWSCCLGCAMCHQHLQFLWIWFSMTSWMNSSAFTLMTF